jgi:hypothetical protein
MHLLRRLPFLLLAATLLTLGACGGGGGDSAPRAAAPAPVQVDSARTTRATLDATGGSVSVTAADGRRYTLTVPPGALASATEITATPVLSMGGAPLAAGLRGAVRFGPAGLIFALPATLRIEGAGTTTSAGTVLAGFLRSQDGASMQLVPTSVTADAIELPVGHFSDIGVSQATSQQLAQVPVAANAQPDEALMDEFLRGLGDTDDQAADAALLVRLHDTRVLPRLVVAEFRTLATDTEREVAIRVARQWLGLIDLIIESGLDATGLPGGLGPLVTGIRQRVLAILTEDFEAGRTACMAPAPVGTAQLVGLQNALRARAQVGLFNGLGGLPGLSFETVARRLNDCVRVVFEPRPLPSFEVGRPVSLDLRAQLVFAADPNASIQVPFEFDVISFEVDEGGADGFSDAQGNFTSVVTPVEAEPSFDVQACMVVNLFNGGPFGSALCGQQILSSAPSAVVLAGRATRTFNLVDAASGGSVSVLGTVDFRVRAEADGTFTVLEALGTLTDVRSGNAQCRPDGITLSTQRLTTRIEHAITRGGHFGGGLSGGFGFRGPTTRTVEIITDGNTNCNVVTVVDTSEEGGEMGNVLIISIERDANGLPTVITLGGNAATEGEITGSLRRE